VKLSERWQEFNERFRQEWMENNPGKTKVAAGLACGALWTVSKGMLEGDIVLCPNGQGAYLIGEIVGTYYYAEWETLPHLRSVRWMPRPIQRDDMSTALRHSLGSIGTVSNATKHTEEIEALLGGQPQPALIATDEYVEDPTVFGLEKHLEEFLVANWASTELGTRYDIYEVDGEVVGQQYPSDTGPIDILAISKDKRELLVVELKKGRASDVVVGQIQRYMGFAQHELAEVDQTVKGVIIGLESDLRLRRALSVTPNIKFYRYEVNFKLIQDNG
jgi:restriction system protein